MRACGRNCGIAIIPDAVRVSPANATRLVRAIRLRALLATTPKSPDVAPFSETAKPFVIPSAT